MSNAVQPGEKAVNDPFRKEYRILNEKEKAVLSATKTAAGHYFTMIESSVKDLDDQILSPDPRMIALAKTKLEESVMWFTKAITG